MCLPMSDRKLQLVPNPARRGPFGALLDAAAHDVEAAKGLAYAYETMPLEQRERMVESIVEDAEGAAETI